MLSCAGWNAPVGAGSTSAEQVLLIRPDNTSDNAAGSIAAGTGVDTGNDTGNVTGNDTGAISPRLLILPPLFDEANKFRRQIVEIMRKLAYENVLCILPDLPGCNDSLYPQDAVTLPLLRDAVQAASEQFEASHCFAIRNAALFVPDNLPGWRYAPCDARSGLRKMMRAQILAAQEAGRETGMEALQQRACEGGITLGGWSIGSEFYRQLSQERLGRDEPMTDIDHESLDGSALWLRAEPDEDAAQASQIAAIIHAGITGIKPS